MVERSACGYVKTVDIFLGSYNSLDRQEREEERWSDGEGERGRDVN